MADLSIPRVNHTDSQTSPYQEDAYRYDTTECDQHIDNKEFSSIITNKKLFLTIFYKACASTLTPQCKGVLEVTLKDKKITVSAQLDILTSVIKVVQHLRSFMEQSLPAKRPVEILEVKKSNKIFLSEQKQPAVYTDQPCIKKKWYNAIIKPALSSLAQMCGASYTSKAEKNIFSIQWQKQYRQIVPKPIEPPVTFSSIDFYNLQRKTACCDFVLLTSDRKTIHLHSVILFSYGGPLFQQLLKDTSTSRLNSSTLLPYSEEALKVFIDFLYLGGQKVMDNYQTKGSIGIPLLIELLLFAKEYKLDSLIDCCTNLLALHAQDSDIENLSRLATAMRDPLLKHLCSNRFTAPKPLDPFKPLSAADFYNLRKEKTCCDVTLITDTSIPMFLHSAVLCLRGGPSFQDLGGNSQKKLQDSCSRFCGSTSAIDIFVMYLYLGSQSIMDRYNTKGCITVSLLRDIWVLAYNLRLNPLVDCCTNLLVLHAQASDITTIKYLVERYGSNDLEDLCTAFSQN